MGLTVKNLTVTILVLIFFSVITAIIVSAGSDDGGSVWAIAEPCPSDPFCVDTTLYNLTNGHILNLGESYIFNTTIKLRQKGSILFKALANHTGNGTEVYSEQLNFTVFQKDHMIPLCSNTKTGDVFCVNASDFNHSVLNLGESFDTTYDLRIHEDVAVPSNWTFFAFANTTANSTEVESDKIIITISTSTEQCRYSESTIVEDTTFVCDDFAIDTNSVVTLINSILVANRTVIHDGSELVLVNSTKIMT